MKRSQFFKSIAAFAGVTTTGNLFGFEFQNETVKKRLRIAHLTDSHILPRKEAIDGIEKMLQTLKALNPAPEYVLLGGDNIMDALNTEKEKVKEMWELFDKKVKQQLEIPFVSCIGNHDVYGWDADDAVKQDKQYGKQWALEELEMKNRFFSFSKGNWHFIILDTVQIGDGQKGYFGKVDAEQIEWLKSELKINQDKNVCVLSHIPIMTVCPFYDKSSVKEKRFEIGATWQIINSMELKDIFKEAGNVKLCLSGHTHMHDKIEYLNTTYLCNGAISGNWWNGIYKEFPPAFSIIDLYEDGTFSNLYIPY